MKKFIRRACGVCLALSMLCVGAVPVFAQQIYKEGTYNGQYYGTGDICHNDNFYSETGSVSDYYLKTEVTFYYSTIWDEVVKVGTIGSSSAKKSSAVTFSESTYVFHHIVGKHYVNGTLVQTVTAYAS